MSKVIKVDEDVYNQLDTLRGKSETFGQVIAQLLEDRISVFHFLNVLEGQTKYNEWKLKKAQELDDADRAGVPGREFKL